MSGEPFPIHTLQMQDGPRPGVNARDLHAGLEVKKDYSNWIKNQIERADLIENKDYILIRLLGGIKNEGGRGGNRRSIDYLLTTTAAKEVALMSATPKGKQFRRYLVEVEDRWRAGTLPPAQPQKPLADWQKEIRHARRILVAHLLVEAREVGVEAAITRLISAAKAGRLPPVLLEAVRQANARAGDNRTISRRTLQRFITKARRGDDLAPQVRLWPEPEWLEALLSEVALAPNLREAHRRLLARDLEGPSYYAARRALKRWKAQPDAPALSPTPASLGAPSAPSAAVLAEIRRTYGPQAARLVLHQRFGFPDPSTLGLKGGAR